MNFASTPEKIKVKWSNLIGFSVLINYDHKPDDMNSLRNVTITGFTSTGRQISLIDKIKDDSLLIPDNILKPFTPELIGLHGSLNLKIQHRPASNLQPDKIKAALNQLSKEDSVLYSQFRTHLNENKNYYSQVIALNTNLINIQQEFETTIYLMEVHY